MKSINPGGFAGSTSHSAFSLTPHLPRSICPLKLTTYDVPDESYRKAGKLDTGSFSVDLDLVQSGLMEIIRSELLKAKDSEKAVHADLYKLNVYRTSIILERDLHLMFYILTGGGLSSSTTRTLLGKSPCFALLSSSTRPSTRAARSCFATVKANGRSTLLKQSQHTTGLVLRAPHSSATWTTRSP